MKRSGVMKSIMPAIWGYSLMDEEFANSGE
jgi:hypothetical protein